MESNAQRGTVDYYEFLQISPHADADTIHRVYRFLAARFHPDNPVSGDSDLFHLVKNAYDVLSDPKRRAEYDATCKPGMMSGDPLSASVDFMDNMEGELNRRLAVLAVLYHRRRTRPDFPEVALDEIETRMGFPRDYLDFTMWYLAKKGYITKADNAQFALTADGVDFVETQRGNVPVLNKMLTSGSERAKTVNGNRIPDSVRTTRQPTSPAVQAGPGQAPIILPGPGGWNGVERRHNREDRRKNSPGGGRRSTDH